MYKGITSWHITEQVNEPIKMLECIAFRNCYLKSSLETQK